MATPRRGLREAGISAQHVSVPSGEASKDFAHLEKVLDAVLEQRPERGSSAGAGRRRGR